MRDVLLPCPDHQAEVVIVGAGHAAVQVADSLRRNGFGGSILILGDEAAAPYQRPPLSKGYLTGKLERERLGLRSSAFYDEKNVGLLLGAKAVELDPSSHTITLASGSRVRYRKAVIATGSRMRRLVVPGSSAQGVHYVRTIEDVLAIRRRLDGVRHVVVIGGGFIGLEAAASLRSLGKEVAIVEMADRLMSRAVGGFVSNFYEGLHSAHGVLVHLDAAVSQIGHREDKVSCVVCADGTTLRADLVIVGIGVMPNTDLAVSAGLACEDGIVVDEFGQSSDVDILAAGDCTNHLNAGRNRRWRLESVQNAVDQGTVVAAALCERFVPYMALPWFWSDQYDVKLQIAGVSAGHDEIVLTGNVEQRSFSVLYFKEGELIAADSVNRPFDHGAARRLLSLPASISPAQAKASASDLNALAPA